MQDTARPSKRAVELAIDASLLDLAEARQLDLAAILEQAIKREQLHPGRAAEDVSAEDWRRDNAEAIRAWNDDVLRNGLWSDGLRRF